MISAVFVAFRTYLKKSETIMPNFPKFQTLICGIADRSVLHVRLNRPEKLNAFNAQMARDLARIAEIAGGDPGIRAVVFEGSGRAFSAGGDIQELLAAHDQMDAAAVEKHLKVAQDAFDRVEDMPKPTIAAINGHAVGAGFQLCLACDFRLAAKGVRLGVPDAMIGIIPALGATTRLPKLVGLARAKEMILCGALMTSEAAYAIGLVNQLVESDALEASVRTFTQTIVERAPLALSAAKALLNKEASLADARGAQKTLLKTQDAREGLTAFLEKRRPVFKGS